MEQILIGIDVSGDETDGRKVSSKSLIVQAPWLLYAKSPRASRVLYRQVAERFADLVRYSAPAGWQPAITRKTDAVDFAGF
jgi:hypothetical protein